MALLGFQDPASLVAIVVILGCLVYSFWRKALLTLTITVALCIIFGLEAATNYVGMWADLSFYANVPFAAFLGLPQVSPPWTVITYQFLHASPQHLLFNVLAFVLIAPPFEERIGSFRFGVLYFSGGIVGALGFALLNLSTGFLLVGASASISAIFGAYGRLYPRDRVTLFFPIPGLPALPMIDVVIGFLVLETALSFFGGAFPFFGAIAWQAHVIAMIFGLAVAPVVMRIPVGRKRQVKAISFGSWQTLATTPELRSILEEAQHADLPEIRDAWLEKFVQAMRCPQCGGPVKRSFGRLSSPCGWKVRLA